jgi:PAS domain S-box-containing protein
MMDINEIRKITKELTALFVEDNKEAREELCKVFQRFFKKVDCVQNGKEGLELFEKNKYDVVITDIYMPVMNGLEMLKKIKFIKSDAFLFIVTAYNETEYYLDAIKIGVDGFILKPIELDQLLSIFQKVAYKYKLKKEVQKYYSLLLQYQQVVDNSAIVCKINTKGNIIYVNEEFIKCLKYSLKEIIGKKYLFLQRDINEKYLKQILEKTLKEKSVWRGVLKLKDKFNNVIYIKAAVKGIFENNKLTEFILIGYDITEIMKPKKFLLEYINNHETPILCLIEIENFENLRGLFGERLTDEIESKFEKILKNKLPDEIEEIYNLENGQFGAVFDGSKKNGFESFIEKLKKSQKEINNSYLEIEGLKYDVSVLISVSKGKECFENARVGLDVLKKEKRIFIISDGLVEKAKKRAQNNLKILHLLKEAINNNEIVCAYQPIVDNKTEKIIKYEALVRIKKGDVLIPPGEFLNIAKKGSFYSQLTKIIISHSIERLKTLPNLSINISEIDIEKESTRKFIYDILNRHKDLASRITFELLEDEEISKYYELDEFIDKIKNLGVKIAIDDFGSGYSNFYRLKKYKPDFLKIDGTLIKDIVSDNFSESIVRSIVEFAKENNIKTIAEYVENREIFEKVKEIGIDYSQGYYFGKPSLI